MQRQTSERTRLGAGTVEQASVSFKEFAYDQFTDLQGKIEAVLMINLDQPVHQEVEPGREGLVAFCVPQR
jgi:hypothetical protein